MFHSNATFLLMVLVMYWGSRWVWAYVGSREEILAHGEILTGICGRRFAWPYKLWRPSGTFP